MKNYVEKSKISDNVTSTEIAGKNVFVKDDNPKVQVDSQSKLYSYKKFSIFLDNGDPVSGKIYYEKFESNGINHVTKTELLMPVQKMKIIAVNQNYSQRVK
ncbi:MAG: hypothetical protein ABI729_10435 [Chitinophagales bacterium]